VAEHIKSPTGRHQHVVGGRRQIVVAAVDGVGVEDDVFAGVSKGVDKAAEIGGARRAVLEAIGGDDHPFDTRVVGQLFDSLSQFDVRRFILKVGRQSRRGPEFQAVRQLEANPFSLFSRQYMTDPEKEPLDSIGQQFEKIPDQREGRTKHGLPGTEET